ncbi:unnamed protein product [Anisakis simplex]|uniref:ANK_REP_REGION domain-containing protein n=1 Tax=Anisakis simplex TaxID=6269 RepID=A0A0M3JTQ5_ANISI|nr:unnamed protein product [Anisakis simplex]
MGNASSTVTAGIKDQVDNRDNVIYKLGDVSGNGELALLAKEALRINNCTVLDQRIIERIQPLLYNGGDGKMLRIEEVIAQRHRERTGNTFALRGCGMKKFVCWQLNHRGAVGETLLHVCFLSGLPEHMKLLAQRLLHHFPKIINDFYLCDEYYEIVRYLLKNGADVSQRTCGNFFTCDDQKNSRTDSPDQEAVLLSRNTTYDGNLYFGEYPLSFAACLSQSECFRMLIAYGADPNWQDSNGNTVLHIATIHQKWEMFKLALSLGANLHIENRRKLTPLTLAAYLAKKEMFERIVEEEREVCWTYGGMMSAVYPLEHLDSIEPSSGRLNRNSALAIVVYGNSTEHLSLLPNLLEKLVHKKWVTYGRKVLFGQLATFIVYFATVFWCFLLRPTPFEQRMNNSDLYCLFELHHIDMSALNTRTHSGFPAKAIFLTSCTLIWVAFCTRLLCLDAIEDKLWVLIVLLTAIKFLFYCRGFKIVGPFVLMLYKIIMKDLLRFFIIYCVIAIGFSQAFYVIFLGFNRNDPRLKVNEEGSVMRHVPESFIRMFLMSLTEFTVLFDQLDDCELAVVGKITFVIYMLLVTMLLINMLIAMMTNTYTEVSENSLEWLRQWSAIILMMEQSFDPATRLKYQSMYSVPMEDCKRIALLLKLRIPVSLLPF